MARTASKTNLMIAVMKSEAKIESLKAKLAEYAKKAADAEMGIEKAETEANEARSKLARLDATAGAPETTAAETMAAAPAV